MTDVTRIALAVDSRQVRNARGELDNMQRSGQKAEQTVTRMGHSMASAARLATTAFAGLGAAIGVRELVQYSDAWTQVNNQLKQVTNSESELTRVRNELLATARSTNSELGTTVNLYSEMFRATRTLGTEQAVVADVTKTINNLFKAGGKAASETAGAVRQLSQGLASGALRGDEFNSVAEGAPRILDALAEHTGMAKGELREFAAEGKISAELLVGALRNYSDEAQRLADMTEETFGQKMVNARTNLAEFIGEMESVDTVVDFIGSGIESLTANLGPASDQISLFGTKFNVFAEDAGRAVVFVTELLDAASREWGDEGKIAADAISDGFMNLPENVHAFIQLTAVELAAIIDYGQAYAEAFTTIFVSEFDKIAQHAGAYGREIADAFNPFKDSFDLQSATAQIDAAIANTRDEALRAADARIAASRAARLSMIEDILVERDTALQAYDDRVSAAKKMFDEYLAGAKDAGEATDEFTKIKTGIESVNDAGKGLKSTFDDIGGGLSDMGQESRKAFRIMQRTQEEGTKGYRQMEVAIQAMNVVAAVGAVIKQASEGDPYTAFGRMAVMAGAMASLGVSVGSLSANGDISADRQATQGTGSVLGMWDEKSESIANASEITADATSELVGINRGMLSALRVMQQGIIGATGQIARSANGMNFRGAGSGLALDDYISGSVGSFAGDRLETIRDPGQRLTGLELDFVGDWLDDVLGGSSEVINQGVVLMGGTVSQLINDTLIQAFQDVESRKHVFDDYDTRRQTIALSESASSQFQLIFASMANTVQAGAEALGMAGDDVSASIARFRVARQEISLKGLSAEDQQAQLEAVFSSIFDGLVGSVLPFIDDFQRVGEGLGETLVRVATNVQVTQEAITRLGFTAQRVSVEQFAHLSTDLIAAAGGLEQFMSGMGSFIDNFATDAHKFDVIQSDMQRAFERVNLEIPETRDGMWELMQTLDAGTESGRAQIAALLELSATADEYYKQQDKAQKEALRAAEEASRAQEEVFRNARAAGISAVSDIARALRSELSGISGALSGLRGQFEPAREAVRSSALSTLRDALLTGDLAGTGNAARTAAQISAESFTSSEAFKREQARTLFLLDSLEREGVQQIDTAEQSLNVLQNIDSGIASIADVLESLAGAIVFDGGSIDIPQFANGGSHSGGLRIVGERGPELEMTGPSNITSNSELSKALASNAELIQELREMKQYIRQTTKNTGETRDRLNRWDRTGLPEERVFE